jgi:hypothetical protein
MPVPISYKYNFSTFVHEERGMRPAEKGKEE